MKPKPMDRIEKSSFKANKQQNVGDESRQDADTKKPFDKKLYRMKKYSKKYKLEQWEEQRKKVLLRKYYKDIKKDGMYGSYKPISFDDDDIDSNEAEIGKFVRHPDWKENKEQQDNKLSEKKEADAKNIRNKDPYLRAKEKLEKIKEEKLKKREEIEKNKEEKKKKLEEYKKKKQDRFKKLSRKTKKGQPVMTGRLELLLEKLQRS